MRKFFALLAAFTLFTSLASQALAWKPSVKATPLYENRYPIFADNLTEFFQMFMVVEGETESDDYSKFQLEMVFGEVKGSGRWDIEFSIVPVKVVANNDSAGEYYDVIFANLFVYLRYSGPQFKTSESMIRPMVMAKVRIKLHPKTQLTKDEAALLINAIKTDQPLRIRGYLSFDTSSSTLEKLLDELSDVRLMISEINGQRIKQWTKY